MQLTSENLVIVTRDGHNHDVKEVLVGNKKRGRFAGHDIFPGGKAEGTALQPREAARELGEETGIIVAPEALRCMGRLVIHDMRPGQERFGNVFVYGVDVPPNTEATETDELDPRWQPVDDPEFAVNMPPDVGLWWPTVRRFNGDQVVTHIIYDADDTAEVIVKEPDFAHQPGKVIQQKTFSK